MTSCLKIKGDFFTVKMKIVQIKSMKFYLLSVNLCAILLGLSSGV